MNKVQAAAAFLSALAAAGLCSATPVVNGTLDAEYGSPITVQSNSTGFGDNNVGLINQANGSELDAGYGVVSGGNLYVFLAGNLETNFNKLDIFIDSKSGGMNRLADLPTDQGNFNNMGGNGTTTGLRFDTGFAADQWISVTAGNDPNTDIFVDSANLQTLVGNFAGQTTPGSSGALINGNGGATIALTFNNLNTTGVTGSTAPNNAGSVPTGIEFSISLADLGYTSGDIQVSAFINNGSHNYLSNQILGGLPLGTGNLGGDNNGNFTGTAEGIDFQSLSGNQYFTVSVPEPASLGLLGIASLGLLARRGRRRGCRKVV
jgi:hypothetical protein